MTHDEALAAWTRCVQLCERKGNYYPIENDGCLARKLRVFKDAEIEEVKPAADALWPSGAYKAILKVGTHYLAVR